MKPMIYMLLLLALGGCSVKHADIGHASGDICAGELSCAESEEKIRMLRDALMSLSSAVSEEEAKTLARAAVLHPRYLARRYGLVSPPYLHNFLITLGVKERGLCYHWAGDLMAHFKGLGLKSFEFYRGVAEQGNLREHHSVVVTARGAPFYDGILLDAWRGSSDLYFSKVGEDGAYRWRLNRSHAAVRAR